MISTIRQYLLITLATIALLLLATLSYVAYLAHKVPPRTTGVHFHKVIAADVELGYVSKPNLNVDFIPGKAITNDRGARIAANELIIASKQADALVVGCSQVYGLGMPAEHTFAHKLAELSGLSVLNLGVSGYGSVAALKRAEQFLDLNPKYVVLGFYYDHVVRDVSPCFPGYMLQCLSVPHIKYDQKSGQSTFVTAKDNTKTLQLTNDYYNYMAGNAGDYSFAKDFYWKLRTEIASHLNNSKYFFGRRDPSVQEQRATTEYLLTTYQAKFAQHGAKLIVIYLPNYFGNKVAAMPNFMQEIANQHGIKIIDLTSDLQTAKNNNIEIMIPNDGHLNQHAHNIIAQRVYEVINQQF